jgi:hypothetical protein
MSRRGIMEDIVLLLRGFFSTPVISSLGRLGVLDALRSASSFTADDFSNIPNKKLLQDTFHYFARLGLIENMDSQGEVYKASDLGKEIFRRASSFYVPHSYFEYMYHYHDQIQNPSAEINQKVERLENVIGSGKTHQRYFPPAISFLKRKVEFEVIADIGCGDGHFLSASLKGIPGKKVVGIDISQLSTEVAYKNLHEQYPNQEISMVCSDAVDVKKWSAPVRHIAGRGKIVISMWFLLHEISRNKRDNVIEFLNRIHQVFPDTPIVIGEVVRQSDDVLSKHSAASIMPEYLFFHELSGQGVLSWDEYQQILYSIPYELLFERLFDEFVDDDGKRVPGAFVWCVMPK